MRGQTPAMLFAWEGEARSAPERWVRRLFGTLVFGGLFLLPLLGWLAAEPAPYRDPAGHFSITPPEGWALDDSGHMGPGLVAKGPAGTGGVEPIIHLTHEPAGIVTLEVRWQTLLGQMRFDNERLRFITIADRQDQTPPHGQSIYMFRRGEVGYQALTRLVLADGRFYHLTYAAHEDDFDLHYAAILAAFDSLRPGGK